MCRENELYFVLYDANDDDDLMMTKQSRETSK